MEGNVYVFCVAGVKKVVGAASPARPSLRYLVSEERAAMHFRWGGSGAVSVWALENRRYLGAVFWRSMYRCAFP
jgi:hypothetical protein